jgi:hypothetical protein
VKITFEGHADEHFRSALERRVADELDRLSVPYTYELAVTLPNFGPVPYLPDFTIEVDSSHLDLPRWVECKPQAMLYTLRDVTGVTRRAGEYFETDVTVEGVTAGHLVELDLKELAKPKRLAELSGDEVLVIGDVGRTKSLTALLTPDTIMFSRHNRFVNQRGVELTEQRAQREAAWRERAEIERQRYEQARAQAEAEREKNLWVALRAVLSTGVQAFPRYASSCAGCQQVGDNGMIYKVRLGTTERWIRICPACKMRALR